VAGRPRRKPVSDAEIDKIDGFSQYALLPWVLLVLSPVSGVLHGGYPRPSYALAGLGLFVLLYCAAIVVSFRPRVQDGRLPFTLALLMVPVTGALAGSLSHALVLYPLLAVVCAVVVPNRGGPLVILGTAGLGAFTAYMRGQDSDILSTCTSCLLAGGIVFVLLKLFNVVVQLKETRRELARAAVAEERLRFSRDLHDLLGQTMSVVAIKAEAVRRLAPRDPQAAADQAESIEQISRRALAEIREAVTGYRETSLAEELDRARSLLGAARIEPVVRESGPQLTAQAEKLLAWIVREGVTNVVRHSGAKHCEISLERDADPVRLSISDDGVRPAVCAPSEADPGTGSGSATASGSGGSDGNGLRGLTERLAAVGGTLEAGPWQKGFRLLATLPAKLPAAPSAEAQGRGGNGSGAPMTA
jgi:two-component system, NarL family, sensor histidine kinase DesK